MLVFIAFILFIIKIIVYCIFTSMHTIIYLLNFEKTGYDFLDLKKKIPILILPMYEYVPLTLLSSE